MQKNGKNGNGNGNRGRRPTDEERAWLWARWQELHSETQLAKEHCPATDRRFARSTIHRIREANDWDGRTSDIRRRAQELADERSAEDLSKIHQALRALCNAQLKKLLTDKGEMANDRQATVTNFVACAKLMREMMPDAGQRVDVHVIAATEEQAQTIIEVINSIVKEPAEREAILAGVLGTLGRRHIQSRAE